MSLLLLLRWAARACGLIVAGGYFLLMAGEMLTPHSGGPSTVIEWTGIVLLTTACVGMLAAWYWELPAALVSLASLAAFALLIRMGHHAVLIVLAIPGVLYVADWLARRANGSPLPASE
jgi:hypothetical protein